MSNYVKTKDFAAADALATGAPAKAVKGTDFGLEYDNIATAVATKVDTASNASLLSLVLTGSSLPANGIYLPSANTLGLASNSAQRATVNAAGAWTFAAPTAGIAASLAGFSGSSTLKLTTGGATDDTLYLLGGAAQASIARFDANNTNYGIRIGAAGAAGHLVGDSGAGDAVWTSSNGTMRVSANGTNTHLAVLSAGPAIQARGPNIGSLVDMTPDKGSFTATLTGMTAGTTGTLNWVRMGNIVILYAPASITGTSNTTAMTLTGLPAAITPSGAAGTQQPLCMNLIDNAVASRYGSVSISTAGAVTFLLATGTSMSTTGFTAAGTKGITTAWQIAYSLA